MKKHKTIIATLTFSLIIICLFFIKYRNNTNTFVNYYILNYLYEMEETFLTLSIDIDNIDNEEEFIDTLKMHRDSIEEFCFLSRKLKVINSNYEALDLNPLYIYILDITASPGSITAEDLAYHKNNLKHICNIFISLSNSSNWYTIRDYHQNVNRYNLTKTYSVSPQISDSFTEIINLSQNGILKANEK